MLIVWILSIQKNHLELFKTDVTIANFKLFIYLVGYIYKLVKTRQQLSGNDPTTIHP